MDHEFQYFAFSLSEEVKCFFKIPAGKFAAAFGETFSAQFGDRFIRRSSSTGFSKKFGCTRLQRRNGEINVGVSRKDDDGQRVPAAAHFHLQLRAVMSGMLMSRIRQPGTDGASSIRKDHAPA